MVLEKKILKVFPMISIWELNTFGVGQFGPHGYGWHDLCRGPLGIATKVTVTPYRIAPTDAYISNR